MPVSWKQLKERGFDRESYRNCDRFGWWDATVDAAAYSQGSRVSAQNRGKRAGIHLFVRADDGAKWWVYVLLMRDSSAYRMAGEVNAGDRIRLETVQTQADHAWVKSLEKQIAPK